MLVKVDPATKVSSRIPSKRLSHFGLDERGFQDILFRSLEKYFPDDELLLLGQSRYWQEEPDLFALNANGDLFLFELKVWEAREDNVLQVLRYGQIFGAHTYDDLNDLFLKANSRYSSLADAHEAKFQVRIAESQYNSKQIFVVMTNGLDSRTRDAIRYWRSTGLDLRSWVYRVYEGEGTSMLLDLNPFRAENDPYEDIEEGFFIVNTNFGNDPTDDSDMIAKQKAAAYFDPWKKKIQSIRRGNWVFLYRNGTGIVGYGMANGRLEKHPYQGKAEHPDEEYSMGLTNFSVVVPPLRAAEIKRVTGQNYSFRGTMFGLNASAGEKLLNHLATR